MEKAAGSGHKALVAHYAFSQLLLSKIKKKRINRSTEETNLFLFAQRKNHAECMGSRSSEAFLMHDTWKPYQSTEIDFTTKSRTSEPCQRQRI
jgi:hypothetical protein